MSTDHPKTPWANLAPWQREILSDSQRGLSERERWRVTVTAAGVDLTPTETLVGLVVANYWNSEQAAAWPSMTTIAKASKLNRATVARTLRQLEDKGWIRRTSTGLRKVNRYALTVPYRDPRLGAQDTHQEGEDPQLGAQDTHVGAQGDTLGADDHTARCTPHPDIAIEVPKEPSKKSPAGDSAKGDTQPRNPKNRERQRRLQDLLDRGWDPEAAADQVDQELRQQAV